MAASCSRQGRRMKPRGAPSHMSDSIYHWSAKRDTASWDSLQKSRTSRAYKDTSAGHRQHELSPRCAPPPESCGRDRRASGRLPPLPHGSHLSATKHPCHVWDCQVPKKAEWFCLCSFMAQPPLRGKAPEEKASTLMKISWRYVKGRKKN